MGTYGRNWSGPFWRRDTVCAVTRYKRARSAAGVLQEAILLPTPGFVRVVKAEGRWMDRDSLNILETSYAHSMLAAPAPQGRSPEFLSRAITYARTWLRRFLSDLGGCSERQSGCRVERTTDGCAAPVREDRGGGTSNRLRCGGGGEGGGRRGDGFAVAGDWPDVQSSRDQQGQCISPRAQRMHNAHALTGTPLHAA